MAGSQTLDMKRECPSAKNAEHYSQSLWVQHLLANIILATYPPTPFAPLAMAVLPMCSGVRIELVIFTLYERLAEIFGFVTVEYCVTFLCEHLELQTRNMPTYHLMIISTCPRGKVILRKEYCVATSDTAPKTFCRGLMHVLGCSFGVRRSASECAHVHWSPLLHLANLICLPTKLFHCMGKRTQILFVTITTFGSKPFSCWRSNHI